jgi:hypothetical protein
MGAAWTDIFIPVMLQNGSKCAEGSHKTRVGYGNNGLVTQLIGYERSITQLRKTTRNRTEQARVGWILPQSQQRKPSLSA